MLAECWRNVVTYVKRIDTKLKHLITNFYTLRNVKEGDAGFMMFTNADEDEGSVWEEPNYKISLLKMNTSRFCVEIKLDDGIL